MELNQQKEKLKEKLKKYDGEYRILHSVDIKKNVDDENLLNPIIQIPTKIPKLDLIIGGGMRPGQLNTLSGETSRGKTTFLITLTFNFAQQGFRSLWFSFEWPYRDLFEKFDWTGLPLPEFYLPKELKYQDMNWLRERIVEAIVKYKIQVMFLDDLHSLLPFNCFDNVREIANRVRLLKSIALENNIIIIQAVAPRRALEDIVPTEKDLRDSSVIGDKSDLVMFIWRKTEKQTKIQKENEGIKFKGNESVLYVAKNRRMGKRDFVPLILNNNLFFELNYNYEVSSEELNTEENSKEFRESEKLDGLFDEK